MPFAFATGYGGAHKLTEKFPAAPVVKKPYDRSRLETTIGEQFAEDA